MVEAVPAELEHNGHPVPDAVRLRRDPQRARPAGRVARAQCRRNASKQARQPGNNSVAVHKARVDGRPLLKVADQGLDRVNPSLELAADRARERDNDRV